MDLKKIGKYIAEKRGENNFTQESLAEKLDVSNRAVSKWERGICLPDANNMAKLCKLFNISYNELLSGEDLKQTDYEKRAEENLKKFARTEATLNKKFLMYENVIGVLAVILLLISTCGGAYICETSPAVGALIIIVGLIVAFIGFLFCTKIETEAGKYECRKCGHLYVPKYSSVNLAMHFGRTRYMTCPKCGKKSWQKKRI